MVDHMGTVSKRTFVTGVAAAALLSGGGAVLLTAPDGSAGERAPTPAPPIEMGITMPGPGPVAGPPPGVMFDDQSEVADYLGLSRDELFEARAKGKSLAEIAADQGKSVDGLKDVIVAAATQRIKDSVDDIVNAKGPEIHRVDRVDKVGPGMAFGPFPGPPPLLGDHESDVAKYLGLSEKELFDARRKGTSLADLAKAQGKSVDGLKDVIVAATKHRLDDGVANGPLSREQADKILEELTARVDDLVEAKDVSFGFAVRGGPPKLVCPEGFRSRSGRRARSGGR
jgi:lambda repressor-like predicted transcriptional regulator